MNRRQRRAARYTKAGRRAHAEATRHICEHGNLMKTDGNGDPMCPHGCGFRKPGMVTHAELHAYDDAINGD